MRALSLALALTAAAAACGEPAPPTASAGGSTRPVRIRVVESINTDVRDVPLHMAFDTLRAAGFDVQQIFVGANELQGATLAQGDADIGVINNQTAWSAAARGADIRTISAFTAYTGLIAARQGVECADLKDRPTALPNTAGFAPLLFDLLMRRRCPGVEPRSLLVPEASARTAGMLAGRFDAAMMPGEELVKLQAMSAGRFYLLASAAVEYPDLQVDGIQVRGRWASEHPDAVRALLTAQLQAHRLIRAEPDVLRREAVGRLRLDPAIATAIADAHLAQKIWDVNGGLTEAGIASTIAFLVETKGLPRALAPADVADLSYLEHVLRAIGRAAPSGEVAPAADPGMP